MNTSDFNNGDLILIELTTWNATDKTRKPISTTEERIYTVYVNSRGKRYITDSEEGTSYLKNFKKDNSVKGSFGMIFWKNTPLNFGYKVLGGADLIRDKKLEKLGIL